MFQFARVERSEVEGHLRVGGAESFDRGREEYVHERAYGSDPQHSRFAAGNLRTVLDRAVGRSEDRLDVGAEGGARCGEARAVLAAAEQREADLALELLDLKIQRLRLHVKTRRG